MADDNPRYGADVALHCCLTGNDNNHNHACAEPQACHPPQLVNKQLLELVVLKEWTPFKATKLEKSCVTVYFAPAHQLAALSVHG